MELIKIIIFEFLLGFGLQGFAIVLGVFVLNKQKLIFKNYILASILVISISYLVRLLPISFGIHTLLNMLFLFLICIIILKMPAYTTIRSALLVTVLLLICEMIDVGIMISLWGKEKFESMMLVRLEKAIIGIPISILFTLIITLVYFISNNPKKIKGDSNGNICK